MRIVHLIEYFAPKLGYQETYLAREQAKLGHDVAVLTSDRYFPFPDYEETIQPMLGNRIVGSGEFMEEGIKVIRLPVLFELFTRAWLNELLNTLKELNPEIIHIHSTSSFSTIRLTILRKQFPNTKILVDDHSHESVMINSWTKKLFYWTFQFLFGKQISQNIDTFVAITPETRELVKKYMGIVKPIHVIELGVDTDLFTFLKVEREKVRERLRVKDSEILITYTGKVIQEKGVDVLVQAFLKNSNKNSRLLIIGNGPKGFVNQLKENIAQSSLSDRVIWVPMLSPKELPAYYSASDIGVWPKQESISMIEAMACNLPIIIKKSNSMKERIKLGNGLSYHEGNTNDLAKKIQELVKDKRKRTQMGKLGRNLAEQYSWEQIAKKFISLYKRES